MTDRGLAPGDRATTCPFVAFADDRDERADQPDHRHRCYAESRPAPRALAHQQAYCLSPNFPACPIFQDWALHEAARAVPSGSASPAGSVAASAAVGAGLAESKWAAGPGGDGDAEGDGSSPAADPGDERDRPSDPWDVADAVDDLGLPPRRPQRRNWAAPPPWMNDRPAGSAAGPVGEPGQEADDDRPVVEGAERGDDRPESEHPDHPDHPVADAAIAAGTATAASAATAQAAARAAAGSTEGASGPGPAAAGTSAPAFLADRERAMPDAGSGPSTADEESWAAAMERASADRAARRAGRGSRPQPEAAPPQTDNGVPPWEPPRRYEAYPSLRTRVAIPRPGLSPLLAAAVVIVLVALLLFFVPSVLLNLGKSSGGAPGTSASPGASASAASPTPVPSPTPIVYIVKKGDTLLRIAKRYGVTVDQIVEANKATVKDPNKIGEGTQLVIPTPVPSDVTGGSAAPSASPSG